MQRSRRNHATFIIQRLDSDTMPTPRLLPLLMVALAPMAGAAPVEYALDPVHSRVLLAVDHAGFSRSLATLGRIEGRLVLDGDDWTRARVEARIPMETLDFGDAEWNRQMASRRWFDAGRHPEARFVSTRVEVVAEGRLQVTGDLRVAGHSSEVVLDVRINQRARNPLTHRPTVGFSATTTLDRRRFGMLAYPSLVGNEVEVRLEIEARRGRANLAEPAPGDEAMPEEEEA